MSGALKSLLPILLKWGGGAALVRSTKSATEGSLSVVRAILLPVSDPSVIDARCGLALTPPHLSQMGRRR